MMSDYGRFTDHKYEWSKPFSSVRHNWSLRGPRGGINFHASITDNGDYDPSCGLEFHRDFDPTNGHQAAHHKNCWLTGGKCWHEGTSLYASEHVWPYVKHCLRTGDHEAIFRFLEGEYNNHFAQLLREIADGL
jgi:hypothetical protein